MDDQPKLHDIAIDDALYHMLYFLARCEKKRIRTLVARAIEEYGQKRGVYVSTKAPLLDVCPICGRDLSEKTVASYLLKRGVWVCRSCHQTLVRERDEWLRKNRPSAIAERQGPRPPARIMRDGARKPAGGGPRD